MLADKRMEEIVEGVQESLKVSVEGLPSRGSKFPVEMTCDGLDRAPRVSIAGLPSDAKSVALIMYDPDAPAGTFIHWLAVQPSPGWEAYFPSERALEGRNDFGRLGYGGPCPPRGHGEHRYFFLALALDVEPKLSRGFTLEDLLYEAKGHVTAWGYAMGTYSR